ncbi:MAG: rod shape-determining protein MreC [Candidatus Eremiobacteraeota bacterium]|nr:rod shape-determining protein MreC [Candidatus Eremiobacteraeota bacterium]
MFIYRDERKLFALISIIIVAALVALVQINAERTGAESPIAVAATSLFGVVQTVVSGSVDLARTGTGNLVALPGLSNDNARLRDENRKLREENAQLHELAAAYAAESAVRPVVDFYHGIEARVVGFPPENESQSITIDKGAAAGVRRDEGVLDANGVVGRVISVGPFTSTIVLITDYTSRVPAVVRRGRWWGIARGNVTSVRMEYIPEDAPLRPGDVVVTGEGRSFHAGVPIGTVASVERGDTTLYQTAVLKPAAALGALDRVVVVPQ